MLQIAKPVGLPIPTQFHSARSHTSRQLSQLLLQPTHKKITHKQHSYVHRTPKVAGAKAEAVAAEAIRAATTFMVTLFGGNVQTSEQCLDVPLVVYYQWLKLVDRQIRGADGSFPSSAS